MDASADEAQANGEASASGVWLLTPQQAAYLCQVSIDRIYEWSHEPGFPVIVSSHQLRIHARLFDEWLVKKSELGRGKDG